MKANDFLAAAEHLPFGDIEYMTGGGGLVVVAPHPDDESLGCGGLIAEACSRNIDVRLVVVSDGVGSHPNSQSYPPDRLRRLREDETYAAASALGLKPQMIRFLRLPDRRVPTNGREAISASRAIVEASKQCAAGAIAVTWRYDPHCDHEASALLVGHAARAMETIRVFSYPVWGWTLPADTQVSDNPDGMRLDIARWHAQKRAAILSHRSQTTDLIDDDPGGFCLDETMIERSARPFEIYLRTDPRTLIA